MRQSFRFWMMLVVLALAVSACGGAAAPVAPVVADLQPTDRGLIVQLQAGNLDTQILTVVAHGKLGIQITKHMKDWTEGSDLTQIDLGEKPGLVIVMSHAHTFGLIGLMENRSLKAVKDYNYNADETRAEAIKANPGLAFVRFFEIDATGALKELAIGPE